MIVAGTGHRPQSLPCGFNKQHPWCLSIKKSVKEWIETNQPTTIISGMALGFDTWLAEIAVEYKIPLKAYVPFVGQENKWTNESQKHYGYLLSQAQEVKIINEGGYAIWKLHSRNDAMLNDCNFLLALYDPRLQSGGTFNAIKKAKELEISFINFWVDPQT